jgi:hypothetical protein
MIDFFLLAEKFAINAAGLAKLNDLRDRMWIAEIDAA